MYVYTNMYTDYRVVAFRRPRATVIGMYIYINTEREKEREKERKRVTTRERHSYMCIQICTHALG